MKDLEALKQIPPYSGYLYAYPHKTAYRPFEPALSLADIWREEPQGSLFLYVHIPFCEMRCGFCNLFTMTGVKEARVDAYLAALRREVETVQRDLPEARYEQLAIGGGTPTFLDARQLHELFDITRVLKPLPGHVAIETSPGRATPERLAVLKAHDVSRISMGVESFSQTHLRAMGRPERADAGKALDAVRQLTDADLNIDLIYGAQGQTICDFEEDVRTALNWSPEEIFIYPLYVGPLTGLSKINRETPDWDRQRLAQYRAGRDILLLAGYTQVSMRRFVRKGSLSETAYNCQEDGMVGLGAGARSYTQRFHYSTDYAVNRAAIAGIIEAYIACEDFSKVQNGIELSLTEQMRRYVIKSVLNLEGLDLTQFARRFGCDAMDIFPELAVLIHAGFVSQASGRLIPTSAGFENADAIGPFLVSDQVKDTMRAYQWA